MERDISSLFTRRVGEEIFDSDESSISFSDSYESDDYQKNIILRIKELEKINRGLESQNKSLGELAVENEEANKKLLYRLRECEQKALMESIKMTKMEEVVFNLQTERDELFISSRDDEERKNAELALLKTQNDALHNEKCRLTQKVRDYQEELQSLQTSYKACLNQISETDKIFYTLQNDHNNETNEYRGQISYLEERVCSLEEKLENCDLICEDRMNGQLTHILSDGVVAQCIQFTALLISMSVKCARRSRDRSDCLIDEQETIKGYFEQQKQVSQSLAIELMQDSHCQLHVCSRDEPEIRKRNTNQEEKFSLGVLFFIAILLICWSMLFECINFKTVLENVEFSLRIGSFYVGLTRN